MSEQTSPANRHPFGTSVMSPADSASRAGVTPEASRVSSSGTLGNKTMRVHVKSGYQPAVQLSHEEINAQIASGTLDPDISKGWHAGLDSWIPLADIKGVNLATPPPLLPDDKSTTINIENPSKPTQTALAAVSSSVLVTQDRRSSRWARFFMFERPGTWRRLYAFLIDLTLARFFLEFIAALIFMIIEWWPPYEQPPVPWFIGTFVVIVLFYVSSTALNLMIFGTTLGKFLFGIRVRSDYGHKLRYLDAWVRQTYALGSGAWFLAGFPFITAYPLFRTYQRLQRDNSTVWDNSCGSQVICKRIGWQRYVVCLLISLALFLVYCAFQLVVREQIRETLRRFFL